MRPMQYTPSSYRQLNIAVTYAISALFVPSPVAQNLCRTLARTLDRRDPDYIPPTRYGRSIFVSPFGVLAFGGLTDVWKRERFSNNLWYWNTVLDEWAVYDDIDAPKLNIAHHRNRSDFLRLHDYSGRGNDHLYFKQFQPQRWMRLLLII